MLINRFVITPEEPAWEAGKFAVPMLISDYFQQRIEARDFPSAVYLVAEKGEIVSQGALGLAVVEPERIVANEDTIYDLASVTKVLVAGLLAAKLVEEGRLDIGSELGHYFPELDGRLRQTQIGELLSHASPLPGWHPFYLSALHRSEILGQIPRLAVEMAGRRVIYSDPNFILLTFLLEKLYGERIDVTARREIFDELGLVDTWFNPPRDLRRRIAASEMGNEFERRMASDMGFAAPDANVGDRFRAQIIWGEVHDQNAWLMDGVSGHAGLFSTAEEVFKIAQQFLPNYTTLLKSKTCELFRTNFTAGMNEDRSFAFQLASTPDSTAGTKMSPESFGHNGFTGTSLWIDPVKERVFVLLTNRTHNRELPFANINSVRRRFHDLAVEHLENT